MLKGAYKLKNSTYAATPYIEQWEWGDRGHYSGLTLFVYVSSPVLFCFDKNPIQVVFHIFFKKCAKAQFAGYKER